MRSYLNKKLIVLKKKILKKFKNQKKNDLSVKILINYLIYLNLKTEKLLLTKNFNPELEILKEIKYLHSLVEEIDSFKEFSKKNSKIQNFNLEKNHKFLFQKLWTNYTFDEFRKERLGRYIKRIKINKLQILIKNKKIVDFGCGHGNFLMSMAKFKPKECIGIDYGKASIDYANKYKKNFFQSTIYFSLLDRCINQN